MSLRRARLAGLLALACASTLAFGAGVDLRVDVARKRDAATKRCHAAQRRVERQQEVVAELDARVAKARAARERCEGRACERIDRTLKANDARRVHYERQLAQYEADAVTACAAVAPR